MEVNPIIRKDIVALLRLRRIGAIQFAFVAILGVLLLLSWPQKGVVPLSSHGKDSLLIGLILGQLVLLILFVPGVASVSITSERELGTLEMLYASRLSPAQLIFGKLLSSIGFPLLLLISSLPYIGMLNFRGDVNLSDLLRLYGILITSAVMLAIVSLAISALCRSVSTSVVISYVVVLTICGGVLVPAAIMLSSQDGLSAQILHFTRSISPVAAALSLLTPHVAEFGGRAGGISQLTGETTAGLPPSWEIFFPFAAALIVVSVIALIVSLRKAPSAGKPAGRGPTAKNGRRSLGRRILFLIDPLKKRRPIGNFNPVFINEARISQLRSSRWMIRIFYGALFISLALASMALYGGQTEHADLLHYVAAVLVAFQIGAIVMIDPSLTSPALSHEFENSTFEMLRLTHLSSGQIFWGKFLPAFVPALLPIIAMLPAFGVICFMNPVYLRSVGLMLPVFAMSVALCCSAGLACSTLMKTSASATVVNYFVIGTVAVFPMLIWLASGVFVGARMAAWIGQLSPFVMAVNLLPDGSADIAALFPQHLLCIGGLCLLMLFVAKMRVQHLMRNG
jgi:ABC-type transport system involved in multi-copper enzyme maturation permease subunit